MVDEGGPALRHLHPGLAPPQVQRRRGQNLGHGRPRRRHGLLAPGGGIFSKNNFVEVSATPDYGWEFHHWEENLSGTDNPTNYRFDDFDYNIHFTAVFVTDTTPGGPDDPPPPPPPPPPEETVDARIIAYFPEWGVYQQPYYVSSMIPSGAAQRITHLNYAFGVPGPDPVTGEITCQLDDPYAAYQQAYDETNSAQLMVLPYGMNEALKWASP